MKAVAWLHSFGARIGWRRPAAALLLAAWIPSAFAIDPIILFLLRSMRDRVAWTAVKGLYERAQTQEEQQAAALRTLPALPGTLPPDEEYRRLRVLIDESFLYLSSEQRDEVYKALVSLLSDPKNASMRAEAIADFRRTAMAVRQTYLRLDGLRDAEKKRIASQLGEALAQATPDEREQIEQLLRGRQLPVPPDLNAMLLAQVERSR